LGYTLTDVANKYNCKPTTLARWVQQYKPPELELIHDMLKEAVVVLLNEGIKGSDLTGIVNLLKLLGDDASTDVLSELLALGAAEEDE